MMSDVKLIVFDLDDTLYLEVDYVRSAFAAVDSFVETTYGTTGLGAACQRLFDSGHRGNVFDLALREVNIPLPVAVEQLIDVYRSHAPAIQFEPDAVACLDALRGQLPMGLITDGYRQAQHQKVRALDVTRWIGRVTVTDDWGRPYWKPHPRAFEEIASAMNVAANECVYIGDNPSKDFIAPRQLGWKTVRIRRPLSLRVDESTGGRADIEISDLSNLPELLGIETPIRSNAGPGVRDRSVSVSSSVVTERQGCRMQESTYAEQNELAIDGGNPVRIEPFAPWPHFDDELCNASTQVLRSGKVNYWTGNEGRLFEREYADSIGSGFAIALTNGTVALELALFGLGVGPGDEVIVPSRTFMASASCVVMRGATPVMADVDRDSQTLTVDTIRAVTTSRTKAIIAVHLAGWPCDLDPIMEFAASRGIKVIEDCAQAHGAVYKGRAVGSIGHVGAFSFCQDKIMTTGGEGGLMTTNDEAVWKKCWSLKDHGKSWDAVQRPHTPNTFRWLHESFGTNWRLTEMQSAMGRIMLRRLPEWVATRRRHAATLTTMLSSIDALRIPQAPPHIHHSFYKYYAFLRPEFLQSGWSRDRIIQTIQAEGINCGSGSCSEIYLEKAFDAPGLRPEQRLPVARELGETSLMFLVHPTLTDQEIHETGVAIQKVMAVATRSVDGRQRAVA